MWYSGWSPIATVMNFLIAQGHSPGDSNLPERNNKVTRIFLMSARWNWIIVLNFPLMRFFLVSEEHIFCNQSNLHLQGIETLKLLIVALEIDVHPSYKEVRETWESSRCLLVLPPTCLYLMKRFLTCRLYLSGCLMISKHFTHRDLLNPIPKASPVKFHSRLHFSALAMK